MKSTDVTLDRAQSPHGVIIRAPARHVPASFFATMARDIAPFDVLVPRLAHMIRCKEDRERSALGYVWGAASRVGDVEAWEAELVAALPTELSPIQRFLQGPSWGLSSAWLAYALTGEIAAAEGFPEACLPRDADDFERCMALLNACPELLAADRSHLSEAWQEIMVMVPVFAGLLTYDEGRIDLTARLGRLR